MKIELIIYNLQQVHFRKIVILDMLFKRLKSWSCFIILFIFEANGNLFSQEVVQGGRFYVHHPNGLGIHLQPTNDSETIAILPYGAKVELLKEFVSQKVEYEQILGYWREINTKKYHGYIIDSYLSRYPVPPTNCESLQNYMDEIYRKQKTLYSDEKNFRAITTIYQGGNQYTFAKMQDKKIHKVILKNAKLKDGFFIGKSCSHPAFRGISFLPVQDKIEFVMEELKTQERLKLEIFETSEGTIIIYSEIRQKEN